VNAASEVGEAAGQPITRSDELTETERLENLVELLRKAIALCEQ
jgi:hypothetical protein